MSSIDLRSDYLTKLSELNNFDNILDLQKFIIGNANSAFLQELNISEDAAIIFLSSKLNKLDNSMKNINFKKSVDKKINAQLSNLNEKIDDQINQELENNIEEQINQELENNIEEQIQDQINQELENNIEEQIQDQIFESLNDYFDRLEQEYKEKGWVVCERTENSIMASSSSDGCT
jgi:RNA polymerase-binding transcription factor DksA